MPVRFNGSEAPAVRRVLEPLFGRRWRWVVAALPLLIFWPTLAFWRAVAFDPAHFVEEWTKLALTTLGVFLLVEILQERRHETIQRTLLEDFLTSDVVTPLQEIISNLVALRSTITHASTVDASTALNATSAQLLRIKIAIETALSLLVSLTYRRRLTHILSSVDFAKLASSARGLSSTQHWYAIPTEEFDALLTNLRLALELSTPVSIHNSSGGTSE